MVRINGLPFPLSPVVFGTDRMGAPGRRELDFALLDAYYDAGGRTLDTAAVYGTWFPGRINASERLVGAWLKSRGHRDVTVMTKCAHYDLTTKRSRVTFEDMNADIEASLSSLGTDCLDVCYLHRDNPDLPPEQILTWLDSFIRSGKVRAFAASNFTPRRMRLFDRASRAYGLPAFCGLSNQFSLAVPNPGRNTNPDPTLVICDEDGLTYHAKTGMPLLAFQSTARGYFAKRAAGTAQNLEPSFGNPQNDETFRKLTALSRERGLSVQTVTVVMTAQVGKDLGFPLVPIVSTERPEQMPDIVAALDVLNREAGFTA